MKTINHFLRSIAFFLSCLIILQGCTVYKGTNLTLDDAVRSDGKVKVITNYDTKLKYKRVEMENNTFYGVKKVKGEEVKDKLYKEDLKTVKIKDKTLSTIGTIFIAWLSAIPIAIGIYALLGGGFWG